MKTSAVILLSLIVILLSFFAFFTPSYTGYAVKSKWIEEEEITPQDGALPYLYLQNTNIGRGTRTNLKVFTGTSGMHSLKLYKVNNLDELEFIRDISFTSKTNKYTPTGFFSYSSGVPYYGQRVLTLRISRSDLPGTYRLVAEGTVGTTTLDFMVK